MDGKCSNQTVQTIPINKYLIDQAFLRVKALEALNIAKPIIKVKRLVYMTYS